MAKSPQDNFIRCHAALHTLLSHTIPSLQHAVDTWHHKTTVTTQPCSNPAQCPPFKRPSLKNKSCPECITWATAIEAQVYPPWNVGSLQWMNANSTLFSKDPLEAIKLFILRMPANQGNTYSTLGDFDTASLLMIMGKFKEFHLGDQMVFDNIQKVAQIRNSLAHLKHSNSLHLGDQTFNNYWTDITNLVNCLPGIGRPYFTQQTAKDVITKLTEIKDQSIPSSIQQEALKTLVDDMILKLNMTQGSREEKLDTSMGKIQEVELKGISLQSMSSKSKSLLQASEQGDEERCKVLLQQGADVGARDRNEQTALHLASTSGHDNVCDILLKAGADVHAKDIRQITALHFASSFGHDNVCDILLKAGADMYAKDIWRQTALHLASKSGHDKVCEILLKAGADVHAKDNGQTALHFASASGHDRVCEILLMAGADVHDKDELEQTTLHIASTSGHDKVCEILLKAGADVHTKDKKGQTALHFASASGHDRVCEILLMAGADVHDKDEK
ncbi:uncharacterized protein [Amphiura filiformis]|uniref:uncharacterized protein isoform X2 n=1 Tax=Amphiura filiformis TaxID=82378 RepID=UPI003B213CFD